MRSWKETCRASFLKLNSEASISFFIKLVLKWVKCLYFSLKKVNIWKKKHDGLSVMKYNPYKNKHEKIIVLHRHVIIIDSIQRAAFIFLQNTKCKLTKRVVYASYKWTKLNKNYFEWWQGIINFHLIWYKPQEFK